MYFDDWLSLAICTRSRLTQHVHWCLTYRTVWKNWKSPRQYSPTPSKPFIGNCWMYCSHQPTCHTIIHVKTEWWQGFEQWQGYKQWQSGRDVNNGRDINNDRAERTWMMVQYRCRNMFNGRIQWQGYGRMGEQPCPYSYFMCSTVTVYIGWQC